MIKKQFIKSRKSYKVTFEIADLEAERLELVADFNQWQPIAFERLKNGKWKLTQEVEPGHYQFRYRSLHQGQEHWLNDQEADTYTLNPHGGQNAVLSC
ncbi:MAG: isoamylase early set domain-containing protein [Deinococcales bacterium]